MLIHRNAKRHQRRGATLVEAAITILLYLTIVFGMIDLGQAVFQNHLLSSASRELARVAIVHGSISPVIGPARPLSTWGPATYNGMGNSTDEIATKLRSFLFNIDPATVTVKLEWMTPSGVMGAAGSNGYGGQVRVTLTSRWSPLFTPFLPVSATTLSAVSQMTISH